MGFAAATVAVLLTVSALLTASFEAVAQISHYRTLKDEGFEGSVALAALRADEGASRLSVRLITLTLDLTALGVITATGAITGGVAGPVVALVMGVVLVIGTSEILPQAIAARRPVRLALTSAPFLIRITRVTRPVVARVARIGDPRNGDEESLNNEQRELREIQAIGEQEGVLEESEHRLVERAFRLDELTAWNVMVPRVDIFAWKEELTLADVVGELRDVPYSRIPVYRETVDDVTGIVYIRDAYDRYVKGERDTRLGDVAREPFFVPGSLSLTQLLEDFQVRRIHMGIVADEFGGTDGLVTLEDILEELVGEIRDETDVEEEGIVRVDEDAIEADAGVDVRDIDDVLGVSLPKVEHRSLNGFILEELGHVPPTGESFERGGVRFEILEATETQVLRARVIRLPNGEGD